MRALCRRVCHFIYKKIIQIRMVSASVLICPGGGYEHVSVREGEPVALHFLTAGCHAAVLWYDISKHGVAYPQELKELAWSVAYLRAHADQYAIDKDKILVAGFSAGAHLAASLGCFWRRWNRH